MTNIQYIELNRLYDELNNDGKGFSVGIENDDINKLTGIGKLIVPSESDDKISIYENGEKLILVGNSNGPWAVTTSK